MIATLELESLIQGIYDESQSRSRLDNHNHDPDLAFLLRIGRLIATNLPTVWNDIGPLWTYATDVLRGNDPEMRDEDITDSADDHEEDPSYKQIYRAQDLVKWGVVWLENDNATKASVKDPILNRMYTWLSKKDRPPSRSPEPRPQSEDISITTDEPTITYLIGILDLPYELLAKIIQLALQDDPHVVMTISHVNTALRSFSLSVPSLWTIIDITFPSERIRAHLERSGTYLLRVRASLVLLTTNVDQGRSKLESFKDMVEPHIARIASLEMRYTNVIWNVIATRRLSKLGAFSSLDEFDYRFLIHVQVPVDEDLRFDCKPRRIRLEGLVMKTFRSIYSERVISLKVTQCWEKGLSDWGEALLLMPSLQVLEISDFRIGAPGSDEEGEDASFETSIPDIPLPHLQTITLTRAPREVLIGLLGALQTPNLISATIAFLEPDGLHGYYYEGPWSKPQPGHGMSELVLLPLVSKNPQLEELNLHNCCMTPDMWTAVFGQLHNLKKLRIASSDVTSEALASLLVSSDGSPPALPCLTHITLDNESLDKESGLFFPFIDQLITTRRTSFEQRQDSGGRQTQISPLKSVVLRGWNESHIPPLDELARIRGYVEQLHLETFRMIDDDDDGVTDGEWETQSEGSWASGDQAVVDLGTSLHIFEWGMRLEERSDDWETESDLDDWDSGNDSLSAIPVSDGMGGDE